LRKTIQNNSIGSSKKGNKMYTYPTITNSRTFALEIFQIQQKKALRDLFLTKIIGKNNDLLRFPERAAGKIYNRRFLGVSEIPIRKIVGTLARNNDFDIKFRPLKKHLRDRWINLYSTLDPDKWPPIRVHKIGNKYYVEDGHHRTSVARSMGREFISAEIWEYSVDIKEACSCRQQIIPTNCQPLGTCTA